MWTFVPNNIKGYVYEGYVRVCANQNCIHCEVLSGHSFMIRLNLISKTIEKKIFC